jgi:hypothetical protein
MSYSIFCILVSSVLLLFVSCGEKEQTNPARLGEAFVELPGAHLRVSYCPESELFQHSKPFFQEIQTTIHEAVRVSGLSGSSGASYQDDWATPLNPIVISWDLLQAEHNELKNALLQSIPEQDLELKARSLSQKAYRWQYYLCRGSFLPTSRHSDSRYFLRSRQEGSIADAIAMCEAFQPSVFCHAQARIEQRQGRSDDFLARWRQMYSEHRFERLFLLSEDSPALNCRPVEGDRFEIELPFLENADFESLVGSLENLETAMNYWNHGRIHFKPVLTTQQTEGVVAIEDSHGGLSHVSAIRPWTIVLQATLAFDARMKVLAHELGHVLGFPDCYNEFVDPDTNELIYYELDQERKNLMCSIERGETIPASYIDQMIQRSCL